MCDRCDQTKSFVLGAFIGAATGAVLGVLFAPESGEKTRKLIKAKGQEVLEEAKERIEEAEEKIDEVRADIEPRIQGALNDVSDTSNQIKEDIASTAQRIGEKAINLKNRYFKGAK